LSKIQANENRNITYVPVFVEADSKENLIQAFLKINLEMRRENRYFDIQKDGNKWVAWYYRNLRAEK